MTTHASSYLLIFRDAASDMYESLSAEERELLMREWNEWFDSLAAAGKVLHGQPLEPRGRVVFGAHGERVTDGPFAEAKESIGGYFMLAVADLDEATETARGCPSLKYGMSVEVRPVAEVCHALGVQGRPASMTASSTA